MFRYIASRLQRINPKIAENQIRDIEQKVQAHGFGVLMIGFDDADVDLPFAYTVGLNAKLLPELLLIAPRVNRETQREFVKSVHLIVNVVAASMLSAGSAEAGQRSDIWGSVPILLREIEVQAFAEYGLLAIDRATTFGNTVGRAMQIVLPDPEGRFPTMPGSDWAPIPMLPERGPIPGI